MELAEAIKHYYLKNSDILKINQRFHLASRLTAWCGDETAKDLLRNLKDYMAPTDLATTLQGILNSPVRKVYGRSLRLGYFNKYPQLFGVHEALFRVRHLKEIYGVDAREDLLKVISQKSLQELYEKLLDDANAIRILSRFAIDYIFLYEYLFDLKSELDRNSLLKQRVYYNLSDPIQLHLLIYLYTHVIIADTNFYIRKLPEDRLPIYHQMLNELDEVFSMYPEIRLDNKFEYLVAYRICDKIAPLSNEINAQARSSISREGMFIIDNLIPSESTLNTFNGSEHRNVLYIMSSSEFKPHSQRI
ncbi:hypothetical protein KW794_00625 [Candidatus Saccharibacteria bacterium]|nr:hypothetical protein [Candidatus Saccharibacteria bacterium]